MNKENYKKAINQIHPSEELKRETLQKMLEYRKQKRFKYVKFVTVCAMMIMVCFVVGERYFNIESPNLTNTQIATETRVDKINKNLPRFKSMEELRELLEKNNEYRTNGLKLEAAFDSAESTQNSAAVLEKENSYSKTNVQVENVDEADIVKTDGNYIYHLTNNEILIIEPDTLEIKATIDEKNSYIYENDKAFSQQEFFINDNYLVVLGNENQYQVRKTTTEKTIESFTECLHSDVVSVNNTQTAKAKVYDISNKENPILKREVALSGYYSNSRMIGDYVYFISTQSAYYDDFMKDEEILPYYNDSILEQEKVIINYDNIVYFEDTENYNYTLIAGFNIKNEEEIGLETFLGASSTIYASEKNLYLAQVQYKRNYFRTEKSTIYKFNLENGQIMLQAKGEVKGNLNNQFSMDEYEGNLRIATTAYDENNESSNELYILDKDMNQISKIENLAKGERIYAVRFIGKTGYIVTFKEIDPLFVIDLSDPTNPVVKGELKIPGYSSYLHPYDENHIIGIGYNTKPNGWGGVTNANMKMSMFDISDLENPKEIFNVDIGNEYTYSEIIYNHKALFYHKEKNLIGFPATFREGRANYDTDNFMIYKIDLEKGFEEYGRISQKIDYRTNIERAIYIGNTLFTLAETQMISYNLDTMEELNVLEY